MIFNGGPSGGIGMSEIDFNFGSNFDPERHFQQFSYEINGNSYNDKTLTEAIADQICILEQTNQQWSLKILKTCSFSTKKNLDAIIFMTGGGGAGGSPHRNSEQGRLEDGTHYTSAISNDGGRGGFGGYSKKFNHILLGNNIYNYFIGAGGTSTDITGGDTIITNNNNEQVEIAYGGENGNQAERLHDINYSYGTGGKGVYSIRYYTSDGDSYSANTTPAQAGGDGFTFQSFLYGAGGGGGSAPTISTAVGTYTHENRNGVGGNNGGGDGACFINHNNSISENGGNGIPNSGSGGGGGCLTSGYSSNPPGDGGSGIIILSNYDG